MLLIILLTVTPPAAIVPAWAFAAGLAVAVLGLVALRRRKP